MSKLDYAKRLAATVAYRIVEDRIPPAWRFLTMSFAAWFLPRVRKACSWIWFGS